MAGANSAVRRLVAHSGGTELDRVGDDALLARVVADPASGAFEVIVRRHGPMVFRTCLRLLRNTHDAEDATQAVMLALAQRPHAVRQSLVGFLHGLALAAVKQVRQDRAKAQRSRSEVARVYEALSNIGRRVAPMTRSDLREELDEALARLPGPFRQAVILCHLEGRTQKEAAEMVGCTPVTMGWRTMKGVQRLRSLLQGRGVTVSAAVLLGFLSAEARAGAAVSAARAGMLFDAALQGRPGEIAAALLRSLADRGLVKLAVVGASALAFSLTAGVFAAVAPGPQPASPTAPGTYPVVAKAEPRPPRGRPFGEFEASLDIGNPGRAGAAVVVDGKYIVHGGGATIYGAADQFRFTYRALRGDGEVVARVVGLPDLVRQAMAGVMVRASLRPDSHHVAMLVNPQGEYLCKARTGAMPESTCNSGPRGAGAPWVKVVRQGRRLTACFREAAGAEWKQVAQHEIALDPVAYVGLAVTAHDDSQVAEASFDQVAVRPLDPSPAPGRAPAPMLRPPSP